MSRRPEDITLLVVTKTYPAEDVRLLAELGVTDVAENRDQEAKQKAADTADLPLTWHFVGQLQRNKARSVARYADVVHSVDRARLVAPLSAAAEAVDRDLSVLLQVNLDDAVDTGRGGAAVADLMELAAEVAAADRLDLRGVMAVAPRTGDPGAAFARLASVSEEIVESYPGATWISAGMSGDLEAAITNGATHLRIGSAILGHRPSTG